MKRSLWRSWIAGVPTIVIASAANAHPGHGLGGSSFSVAHYLTEPTHVFSMLIPLTAIVAGCWLLRRRGRARAI